MLSRKGERIEKKGQEERINKLTFAQTRIEGNILFKDIDWSNEDAFYDRILIAWNEQGMSEKDADVWLSKFVMDIVHEDKLLKRQKKKTLARILTNCLILALALTNRKPADLRGFKDIAELPEEEREQILRDLAVIVE